MSMKQDFRLNVTIAWWLKPYLFVLALLCVVTGRVADQAKLEATIKRAMRVTIK
ncbi:hypothetical protein ABXK61_16080 [Burkholderia sola]|uniref:hypothetical protein n=1 Tax=Burkholderia TaxID=32008 RepID=UPI001AE6F7C1|nr:hypothetical protein [Burkholderia sp. AcTa6-5]MBP0714825.1 hypothetical protein [Burkholderia sp. AcTa6-5]